MRYRIWCNDIDKALYIWKHLNTLEIFIISSDRTNAKGNLTQRPWVAIFSMHKEMELICISIHSICLYSFIV